MISINKLVEIDDTLISFIDSSWVLPISSITFISEDTSVHQKMKTEFMLTVNLKLMWSWRKKICLVQFYLKKNQKNALWNSFRDGFFAMEPKQPERKQSSYKGKYARTGKFLKLFVHRKHNNLHVL